MILGTDIRSGEPLNITQEDLKLHMQVVGLSGRGKSKFLEMMMIKFIENKDGFCLIDPHGTLYEQMVNWLETYRLFEKRKIILFDPYEEKYALGFNPLKLTTQSISYLVDMMVLSCASVWGGEDPNQTPLLAKCLTAIFHVLIEKGLSLYEAIYLISSEDPNVRLYLTNSIDDLSIRKTWENFNKKSAKDFDEEFSSTRNRLMRFFSNELIKNIIGQVNETIDFKKIMEEKCIFLVNLKAIDKMSFLNTSLIGTLLINEFYMNCLSREEKEAKANPYYLMIDECGRYITQDIPAILDEGRKFGLHLILSYQRLQQLRSKIGDDGFFGVLDGAQTKVVFGGLGYTDARMMVDDLFLGQINYQEWKKDLTRPVVVGHGRTTLKNASKTEGQAYTKSKTHTEGKSTSRGTSTGSGSGTTSGSNSGSGYGHGDSISQSFDGAYHTFLADNTIITNSNNYSNFDSSSYSDSSSDFSSDSYSENESYSESRGTAESEIKTFAKGMSEALEPIIKNLPFTTYSVDEQKERAAALLVKQPRQYAIIKLPINEAKFVKIPDVPEPYANVKRVLGFKEKSYLSTQHIKAREVINQEIKERHQRLEQEAIKFIEHQKAETEFLKARKKTTIKIKPAEPLEKKKENVRVSSSPEDEKQSFKEKNETYDEQPTIEPSKLAAFRAKSRKKTKA